MGADQVAVRVPPFVIDIHEAHAALDHATSQHYAGRDFRLTDVHGHVVKDILA
jgi:hypothetical protein